MPPRRRGLQGYRCQGLSTALGRRRVQTLRPRGSAQSSGSITAARALPSHSRRSSRRSASMPRAAVDSGSCSTPAIGRHGSSRQPRPTTSPNATWQRVRRVHARRSSCSRGSESTRTVRDPLRMTGNFTVACRHVHIAAPRVHLPCHFGASTGPNAYTYTRRVRAGHQRIPIRVGSVLATSALHDPALRHESIDRVRWT